MKVNGKNVKDKFPKTNINIKNDNHILMLNFGCKAKSIPNANSGIWPGAFAKTYISLFSNGLYKQNTNEYDNIKIKRKPFHPHLLIT